MKTQDQLAERHEQGLLENRENESSLPKYVPATDIYERNDRIIVLIDLPGVSEKDVDIDLEDNVLTIKGTTHIVRQEGVDRLYQEFCEGRFERTFTLSADIDRTGIKAKMKNGVLRLELSKAEKAKPQKIAIQAG
jgi:HSP20 family protein